jgi:hypothetical protein
MYCLLQLYSSVSEQLKPQKPLLKLFAVKAVGTTVSLLPFTTYWTDGDTVFLTFWQASLLSVLAMFGWVKDVSWYHGA